MYNYIDSTLSTVSIFRSHQCASRARVLTTGNAGGALHSGTTANVPHIATQRLFV